MSNRGRPRKSVGQHKFEGTFRHDRHSHYGAQSPGSPVMPKGMNATQRWLWKQVIDGLPSECFGSIDTVSLRTACELWKVWQECKDEDEPQRFYKGLAALKQCQSILTKYGWTPSDRAKLSMPPETTDDDSKRFFGVVG